MNIISKTRCTIYNKVWHGPKGKLRGFLKTKCDALPHNRRMKLVAVLFTVFVAVAFLLFGNACYHIGLGKAKQRIEQIRHIESVEVASPSTENISPKMPYDD